MRSWERAGKLLAPKRAATMNAPPWGVDPDADQFRRGRQQENYSANQDMALSRAPGQGGAMADVGNVEFGALHRPPIALQKATLLSERNLMIDELMQVKKEMNVAQSEMKRMAEAMAQRLGQFEGRLQAGEANVRTLDKREGSNAILTTKLRQEADLRSKEMGSEMGRLRRQVEETLRGHVEGLRGEFRQREQQMLRLEAATRQHAQAVASATEGRARWEGELTNRIDRRFEAGSQAQLNLERQAQEPTPPSY